MNPPTDKSEIRDWWAHSPMTYGSVHGRTVYREQDGSETTMELGTQEFFERVDERFYSWNRPLHTEEGYFAKIFPYERYRGKNVLEIGCGLGTMAMNWARHGAQVTAVDLNPVSVAQTRRRFELQGLQGRILEADSHRLPFGDAEFDYGYSWGVLHHSPDLAQSIRQFFRVLKPDAEFGVMLYNRQSVLYRYTIQFIEGFLHGESRFLGPLELASRYTDGAREEGNPHTWPVTQKEVWDLFSPFSRELRIKVLGTDLEGCFQFLMPGLRDYIPTIVKKSWARRWGWSLWIYGKSRAVDPSRSAG